MEARLYRLVSKPEGESYQHFITALVKSSATFGLVWRDQFRFQDSALAVRRDLRELEVEEWKSARWPGTELAGHRATIVTFRADEAALPVLLRPRALFAWLQPRFPEDIWFSTADGSPVFASIIHEGDAWVFSRVVAAAVAKSVTLELETQMSADDECFRL